MKKIRIFLLAIVILSSNVFACEMPTYITEFKINNKIKSQLPIQPNFKLINVIRAVRADTCRFGVGEIELKLQIPSKNKQGYLFEVVKGKLDGRFTKFTNGSFVVSSLYNKNEYHLEWEDGNTNTQESFDILLKITGVSLSGKKSKPQYLRVSHKGINVPWWNIWRKLPYSATQVIEYM